MYNLYRRRRAFVGKHTKLISFFIFIVYVLLNYYFVSFSVADQLSESTGKLNDLKYLLEDISYKNLLLIITIITTIITTFSLLIQYIIGKFLLVIFAPDVHCHLFYALIPKTIIIVINIIFVGILQIHNSWLYMFTAFIGSIAVLLFFQYKNKSWKASMLFAAAFIIDPIFSLSKEIFAWL